MTSDHPEIDRPEADLPEDDRPQDDKPEVATPEPAAGAAPEEAGEPAGESGGDTGVADFDNLRLVEALLFASGEPLAPAQLARFLPDDYRLEPLLADLAALYANRGVNLVQRGGRWAFRTADDLAPRMALENKVVRKLSRVALETLSVIAYHQPVTRAEIEEIRGVALSKGTLDALLEIGWVRPKGRRKTPGRPVTWGTSDAFLDHFGLESVDALPGVEELKAAGLLDARPALTALSDRGMLPAAGEVAPEAMDPDAMDGEDEEDAGVASDFAEASERELLEEAFGENLLPQEVDLAAAGGAAEGAATETPEEAEDAPEAAPEAAGEEAAAEAEVEMFGGPDDAPGDEDDDEDDDAEDAEDEGDLEDDLEDALGGDGDDEGGDEDEEADDLGQRRQRSAGRA